MKHGALVMMDALGLRARWTTEDPDLLLRKLNFMKKDAEKFHYAQIHGNGPDRLFATASVQFLSDTIVLTLTASKDQDRSNPVIFAAAYASRLMQLALETAIPLAYRGCIAYGEFDTLDNFIVGKAIDEAQAYAESAEGAFVWLLPSALAALSSEPTYSSGTTSRLIRHPIPLKGGTTISSLVATPFIGITTGFQPADLQRRLLETFDGDRVDVMAKRQYSEPFIAEAARRLESLRGGGTPGGATVACLPVPAELDDWARMPPSPRSA